MKTYQAKITKINNRIFHADFGRDLKIVISKLFVGLWAATAPDGKGFKVLGTYQKFETALRSAEAYASKL